MVDTAAALAKLPDQCTAIHDMMSRRTGALTTTEIAERTGLARHIVANRLRAMEALGLVVSAKWGDEGRHGHLAPYWDMKQRWFATPEVSEMVRAAQQALHDREHEARALAHYARSKFTEWGCPPAPQDGLNYPTVHEDTPALDTVTVQLTLTYEQACWLVNLVDKATGGVK